MRIWIVEARFCARTTRRLFGPQIRIAQARKPLPLHCLAPHQGALRVNGAVSEQHMNAVLAVMSGQKPKDEVEALLLAQMAVTHALMMRKVGQLGRSETLPQQDSNGIAFARLSKAFTAQLEALAKLRRGGEQKVTVEHVHVHSGGQAVVGHVTHSGGGATNENSGQAHANDTAAPAVEGSAAMRGKDSQREAVPVSGGQR